jgi:hypothetical protein
MKLLKKIWEWALYLLAIWAVMSFLGSMVKASNLIDGCGKTYPVDYVIFTNLFCEIEP